MRYLAAIRFDDGQEVDDLFSSFVRLLEGRGLRVRGVLQARGKAGGACHCADMDLHAIGSSPVFRISQSLGNGSSACRLDPGVLAECSAFLDQQIASGADLLVLNRFGKGESEGRGFRDLISSALSRGIPVLIAIRPVYESAWRQFSGDFGVTLPLDMDEVVTWYDGLVPLHTDYANRIGEVA